MVYTKSLQTLIKEFSSLPGIGSKTAERLGFHILKVGKEDALALAQAIIDVKENIRHCEKCFNIADSRICKVCLDVRRNPKIVCVVEQVKDLLALEKTGSFSGVYHVLLGRLAPLENQNAEDTTLEHLIKRVQLSQESETPIEEVIIATNPNIEGDTTALFIQEKLQKYPLQVSRIARGIPSGGSIEFANQAMLTDALTGRQAIK